MNHKLPAIGFIGLISFLILSCTHENDSIGRLTTDSFTSLPMETIFKFTESDDIAFRFIRSMQINSHGDILINDPSQPIVFMFDAEGNLIQKIGKKGRGPGEFLNVGSVLVVHDSLAVSDGSSHKIEIFAYRNEKYEHIRTVSVKNQKLLGNLLGLTEKGILIENENWLSPFAPNNPSETAHS